MGALWSKADISKEVEETIDASIKRVDQIQRGIYRPGCPGLSLADLNSSKRYRNTPVANKYTLVDAGPIDANTMSEVCTSIRRREAQKVHLIKTIIDALELYKTVLSLLIDGGYCALYDEQSLYSSSEKSKKWRLDRNNGQSSCAGIFVPQMVALTSDNDVAGSNAWDHVYRLTDRENIRWKYMVDAVRSDFKSGWRKLKKILNDLLVEEILPASNLIKHGKIINDTLSDIETSFQNFMHEALENDMVRPMSVADVNERRLRKTVESSELAAQKNIIKRAGRDSYDQMVHEASSKWRMPLSAAPAVFSSNHFYNSD